MREDFIKERLSELEAMAKKKGLSLRRAAALADLDSGLVYRWKSGKVEPGIFHYDRLYRAVFDYKPAKRP